MSPIVRDVRVQLGNGRTDIQGRVRHDGVSVRIWTPPVNFNDAGRAAAIELTREQWWEFVTDMETLLRTEA